MSPTLRAVHERSYTATDLHRRLRLMQEVLEQVVFDQPQQLRVAPPADRRKQVLAEVASETDAAVLNDLPDDVWSGFSSATVSNKMHQLIEESEALPVMMLYIPVAFTDTQLAPMAQWARAEVDPGLLFDVLVDPRVVGGCAFVYNDRHFDWSLRHYVRAKRGLITSLLNTYGE